MIYSLICKKYCIDYIVYFVDKRLKNSTQKIKNYSILPISSIMHILRK